MAGSGPAAPTAGPAAGGGRIARGRIGGVLARHPRHLIMMALAGGLALGGRPDLAVLGGAGGAVALVTVTRGAGMLAAVGVLAAAFAGGLVGAQRLAAIDHSGLGAFEGRETLVRGFVTRRERPTGGRARFRMQVRAASAGPLRARVAEQVQVRLRGRAGSVPAGVGDEVEVLGTMRRPHARPDSRFDYEAYLRRAGVHLVVDGRRVRPTGRRRGGPAGVVDAVRRRAEAGVGSGLDPPLAALARGMVLGQDERIGARARQDFDRSGLAHLLAVSGQNVTLLALLAWPVLGMLGLGRSGRLAVTLALIALYVPLTGAGPSIVRAGVMGAAGVIAAMAGRPASRWYGLLLAGAASLALDPRAWLDVGWQLSFAAVAGILVLAPPVRRRLTRLPEPIPEAAAMTVAATVATAPLMAFHFGRLSLAALPANLVALPAVAPIMWIGMLSAAAAHVWLPAATLLNAVNGYLLAYTASIAAWFGAAPGAALNLGLGSPTAVGAAYALLGAAVMGAGWATRRGAAAGALHARGPAGGVAAPVAVVTAVILLAALATATGGRHWPWTARTAAPPSAFRAAFLDVGQGDATLLQAPGGVAVLIDGGPPGSEVVESLRALGAVRLDAVVLTHAQLDHQGGLEEVLERIPTDILLDGAAGSVDRLHRRIVAAARARGARLIAARAGQRLVLGGLRLTVLHPQGPPPAGDDADPNLLAVVMIASYRGLDVLLPADAESEVTAGLDLPSVDIVKVAHHGSRDEGLASLLDRLRPRAAVIEVGSGNPYGHPDPGTLATLRAKVPQVHRTDQDGDVVVTLGRGGLDVRSER